MNNPSAQTASNLVTSGKHRKLPKGVLTLKQIRNRVGEGWAVIKNPEHEKGMLVRGELLYHSSDRLDALEEMGKCKKDILHSSSAENVIQMQNIYYDCNTHHPTAQARRIPSKEIDNRFQIIRDTN